MPEALALGNTMIALARNRRYAFHSIGALGVIEMTAPDARRLCRSRVCAGSAIRRRSGIISRCTRCSTSSIRRTGIARCCGPLVFEESRAAPARSAKAR